MIVTHIFYYSVLSHLTLIGGGRGGGVVRVKPYLFFKHISQQVEEKFQHPVVLCELRYNGNNEAVFWKIGENTHILACGTHPF